ncbi:SDR family NAD(P)-dependent oxidoreductase [Saccharothrix coeruleofusca]|uniref:Short-chain dehydrogenase n=1 Tax=Saccharothrix coeruleofusca TaxID=33919 RepID=A0A918AQW0_9PSEU|nr:SDR family NAD(P)-dependent oxidoreductase [Saccharothrix coeruleofusca]GGP71278.1 short-chain dehydrogenase [Saccharothrix coeruleofusca]
MMHTLVMTGATSGIGRVAAAELLRRDPRLRLVVLARGGSGAAPPLPGTIPVDVDLASLASVRAAVEAVRRMLDSGELPPLTGFAGNAGVSLGDARHATPDGYETTFAVNVLANHLLIAGLAPSLRAPARVLITVSDTHFGDFRHGGGAMPPPRWSPPEVLARPGAFPDPDSVKAGRTAYTTSKLAAIHLVHEWSRRLPDDIAVVSYNPGLVPRTGLSRDAGAAGRFAMRWLALPLALTPLADSPAAAGRKLADAIAGRVDAPSGAYIDRTKVARSSDESYDPDRERSLWDHLEHIRATTDA